jgi:tetratricopeptide (TPR) repeat protein
LIRPRAAAAFAVLCLVGFAGPRSAVAVTDTERTEVYHAFRVLFDDHHYAEARPLAERLVEMTTEQYGKDDLALVNPLTNLGTVAYRLKDYPAAEKSYLRAVEILETKSGPTDRQLLRPLQGLGATYLGAERYDVASTTLKRAIDLSRNADGLFNVEQLAILKPLVAAYVALDRVPDAEKEHQYAFRVAESAYGKDDRRMLEPLDYLARWYEYGGRYTSARALYLRALNIAEATLGRGSVASVEPLRGIARTFRLEFLNGPEEAEETKQIDQFSIPEIPPAFDINGTIRLNADGEKALLLALRALEKGAPGDHSRRGATLVELGDWYLIAASVPKALASYRAGWQELNLAHALSLVDAPRQLAYRPPPMSITRFKGNPNDVDEHFVEVQFTVKRDGHVADVASAASDAPASVEHSVIAAVKRARYAPRLENGEPVDTSGVSLREKVLLKRAAEKPSATK